MIAGAAVDDETARAGGLDPSWDDFFQRVDSEGPTLRPEAEDARNTEAQPTREAEETQLSVSTPSTPTTPNAARLPGVGVATLPCKKAPCYGVCPTEETECLKLTRCEECGIVTTLIGIAHHMRMRHGRRPSTSSDGSQSEDDEYQDFLLSPPHQPLLASSSSSDGLLRRGKMVAEVSVGGDVGGTSSYTGRIRSPPYYVETHGDLRMVLSKRPVENFNKMADAQPKSRRGGAATNKRKFTPAVGGAVRGTAKRRGHLPSTAEPSTTPSDELIEGKVLAIEANEEELAITSLYKRKKGEAKRRGVRRAPIVADRNPIVVEACGSGGGGTTAKRPKPSTSTAARSSGLGGGDERREAGNHHDSSPEMRVLARLLSTPGLSITALTSGGKSSPIKADDLLAVTPPPPPHLSEAGSKKRPGRTRLASNTVEELRRKRLLHTSPLPLKFAPHLARALPTSPHSSDSSLSSADSANQRQGGSSAMKLRHPRVVQAARASGSRIGKVLRRETAAKRDGDKRQSSGIAPADADIPDFVRQQVHLESALSSIKTGSAILQQPQHHASARSPPSRRSVNAFVPATTAAPITAGTTTIIGGTRFVAVPLVNPASSLPVFTPTAVPRRPVAQGGVSGAAAAARTHRSREQPPYAGRVDADELCQEPEINASSPGISQSAGGVGGRGGGLKSCLRKGSSNERFLLSHPNHIFTSATQPFILNGSISVDENGIHRLSSFSSSESPVISAGANPQLQRNEKKKRDDGTHASDGSNTGDSAFPSPLQQSTSAPAFRACAVKGGVKGEGGHDSSNMARNASAAQQSHPLLRKYRPIIPRQHAAAASTSQHHINLTSPQLTMMLVRQESQQLHINTSNSAKPKHSTKRLTAAPSLITVGPGDPIPIPLSNRNSPAGSDVSEGRRSVTSHGSATQPAPAMSVSLPMSIAHSLGVINQTALAVEPHHQHHYYQPLQKQNLCSPPPPLQLYAPTQALPVSIPSSIGRTPTPPARQMVETKSFAFTFNNANCPPPPLVNTSSRPTPTYSKLPPILQRHHRASHLNANRQPQHHLNQMAPHGLNQKARGTITADNLPPKLHANIPARSTDQQASTSMMVGESWRDLGSTLRRGVGLPAQVRSSPPFESSPTPQQLGHHRGGMMASPPNFPGASSATISGWQSNRQQQVDYHLMDAPPVLEAQVPIQSMGQNVHQFPPSSFHTSPLQPPIANHFLHPYHVIESKLARPPPQLFLSQQHHRNMPPQQHLQTPMPPLGKSSTFIGSSQSTNTYGAGGSYLGDMNDTRGQ